MTFIDVDVEEHLDVKQAAPTISYFAGFKDGALIEEFATAKKDKVTELAQARCLMNAAEIRKLIADHDMAFLDKLEQDVYASMDDDANEIAAELGDRLTNILGAKRVLEEADKQGVELGALRTFFNSGTCASNNPMLRSDDGGCSVCGARPQDACQAENPA